MNKFLSGSLNVVVVLCLTLGLAPFIPEPHVLGKLRWLVSGGKGMSAIDYFDLLLHGLPWVMLVILMLIRLKKLVWKS